MHTCFPLTLPSTNLCSCASGAANAGTIAKHGEARIREALLGAGARQKERGTIECHHELTCCMLVHGVGSQNLLLTHILTSGVGAVWGGMQCEQANCHTLTATCS